MWHIVFFMWDAYTHSYAYESRTKMTQATWPLSRQPHYYTDPTSCIPWDQAPSFISTENKYSNERTVTTPLSRPKDHPTKADYDTWAFFMCGAYTYSYGSSTKKMPSAHGHSHGGVDIILAPPLLVQSGRCCRGLESTGTGAFFHLK